MLRKQSDYCYQSVAPPGFNFIVRVGLLFPPLPSPRAHQLIGSRSAPSSTVTVTRFSTLDSCQGMNWMWEFDAFEPATCRSENVVFDSPTC